MAGIDSVKHERNIPSAGPTTTTPTPLLASLETQFQPQNPVETGGRRCGR